MYKIVVIAAQAFNRACIHFFMTSNQLYYEIVVKAVAYQ